MPFGLSLSDYDDRLVTADRHAMPDGALATELAAKLAATQEKLRAQMERRGLFERDGWWILEFLRESREGTLLVLRPMHLRIAPPTDMECVVGITESGFHIDARCAGPDEPSP